VAANLAALEVGRWSLRGAPWGAFASLYRAVWQRPPPRLVCEPSTCSANHLRFGPVCGFEVGGFRCCCRHFPWAACSGWLVLRLGLHLRHELSHRYAQRGGQFEDGLDAGAVPAKLKQGQVIAIHLGFKSKASCDKPRTRRSLRSTSPNASSASKQLARKISKLGLRRWFSLPYICGRLCYLLSRPRHRGRCTHFCPAPLLKRQTLVQGGTNEFGMPRRL
jgi:hypothetical protein